MGRGGARVGSGRKRKDGPARWLDGGADKRAPKPAGAGGEAPASVGPVPPVPEGLTPAELGVWLVTAPAAHAAGTLTLATVDDFQSLCTLQVEMEAVLQERRLEGWTQRGLALAREFRGLVTRVESKRRAFCLAPMGRSLVPLTAATDDWAAFEAGLHVVPGGKA